MHSGTIYPAARDPRPLFAALRIFARRRTLQPDSFQLVLRATGQDALMQRLAREAGVAQWVSIAQQVPYQTALEEMIAADGLLLLQGSLANEQIPAKAYEYLRAQRPIFALVDPTRRDGGAAARARGRPNCRGRSPRSRLPTRSHFFSIT